MQQLDNLFFGKLAAGSDLSDLRLLLQVLPQLSLCFSDTADLSSGIGWHPDGIAVIDGAADHALADPFGGVSRKTDVFCIVKLSGSRQKADSALLDQIQQRHRAGIVPTGDGHHQPQIGIDQLADGILVALGAFLRQFTLLLSSEQRNTTDLLHKLAHILFSCEIRLMCQ